MKRAKTHSPGTSQSGGIGKLLYSQPGYSRKTPGFCCARLVRFPTEEASSGRLSGSGRGTVALQALRRTALGMIAKSSPRKAITELAGARIPRAVTRAPQDGCDVARVTALTPSSTVWITFMGLEPVARRLRLDRTWGADSWGADSWGADSWFRSKSRAPVWE